MILKRHVSLTLLYLVHARATIIPYLLFILVRSWALLYTILSANAEILVIIFILTKRYVPCLDYPVIRGVSCYPDSCQHCDYGFELDLKVKM